MTKLEQTNNFFDQNASASKLFFLAIISIALCSFGPMSIFASIPMTVSFLLYGRLIMLLTGMVSLGVVYAYSVFTEGDPLLLGGIYLSAFIVALLVSELVKHNFHPVKGLMVFGFGVVLFLGATLLAVDKWGKVSLREQIGQTVGKIFEQLKNQKEKAAATSNPSGAEERAFDDFISNPDKTADFIYTSLPSLVFGYAFFSLWITLYVTLRNAIVWRMKALYSFSLSDLTNFKAPDYFVYPVIAALLIYLGADYGLPAWSEIVGRNLLYCLGVFYFFQGFGVYNALLRHLRINGFLKTLFIAFTVLFAAKYLAIVGLFDLWFDFRKFFKNKKKDKGDIV